MSLTTRISWEVLRSFDTSTITSSSVYYPIGTPLAYPSIIFKMVNTSSVLVTMSFDGVNDYDVIPSGSFFLYDELKVGNPNIQFLPANTQIYVRGSASTGLVYLATQYLIYTNASAIG